MERRSVSGLLLTLSLLLVACTESDLGTFPVPELGQTEPGRLDNGRPVFVVHDVDGTLDVIEAVSTHLPDDLVGWCPSSRTIDDVFHGARWDAHGRYVAGPGPENLGRYTFEMDDSGTELTVISYVPPSARTESPVGMSGPSCADGGYVLVPRTG